MHRGNVCMATLILNLSTSQAHAWATFPKAKSCQYPLNKRLGGPPELVWMLLKRGKSLATARIQILDPSARSPL